MKLRVLGCGGGIGGRQPLTTSLLVDDDILIDAGSGVGTLDIDALARIDHVFLTHGHLDHVAFLALLVDAVRGVRRGPVTVHASQKVTAMLKQSLFNWALWPDFGEIPNGDGPTMQWAPFTPGDEVEIGGRSIRSHEVNHAPGSVGYQVCSGDAGFLFTGDLMSTPSLWAAVAGDARLSRVLVECSVPNAEAELALLARHHCPDTLLRDIRAMPPEVAFFITHLKPGMEDQIMAELNGAGQRRFSALACGDEFEF
ncbi:Phosphoribosyl 1,2-cyclic phosphodiesterase [Noviherbaspirillum humi]|uniref:Phosphoribosyl 1,2-cyclic phosphodiesterase n=1 Tax=Noviherbaspirillum humi TaxID=1688639 RepID=A0A239J196_9BURK|nr:3',5'-cyclic-nucleotide phosphodiesterase [Noviherbaspirillum humi]SNS99579.1 Phosphoribosyl 1,2-cyclic phosphodiesterase [Noviherbaspirillum humi]